MCRAQSAPGRRDRRASRGPPPASPSVARATPLTPSGVVLAGDARGRGPVRPTTLRPSRPTGMGPLLGGDGVRAWNRAVESAQGPVHNAKAVCGTQRDWRWSGGLDNPPGEMNHGSPSRVPGAGDFFRDGGSISCTCVGGRGGGALCQWCLQHTAPQLHAGCTMLLPGARSKEGLKGLPPRAAGPLWDGVAGRVDARRSRSVRLGE